MSNKNSEETQKQTIVLEKNCVSFVLEEGFKEIGMISSASIKKNKFIPIHWHTAKNLKGTSISKTRNGGKFRTTKESL